MKKKILTTLFVIGAQFFSKTYASKELQVVTPTSTEGGRCLPSTIEGLGGFLRKNTSGVSFPEVGYTAFCSPFLTTRFSSRIDEMKAKNAAIEVFGQMVALAYSAFAEEIERQKKKTPGFDDIAADRQSTLLAYKMNNHTYFLKFQDMITQVLRWAETRDTTRSEANRVLTQPYGLSKDLGMVWIKDNNGIVPATYDHKVMGRMVYSPSMPYGDWGDLYQRCLMVVDGQLIESPGIHVHAKNDGVCKFVRENGLPGAFKTSPITVRVLRTDPIVGLLKEAGIFRDLRDGDSNAFIALPSTPEEHQEFEAALLEELREGFAAGDAGGADAAFAEAFLTEYVGALEELPASIEEVDEVEVTSVVARGSTTAGCSSDILSRYIDSLYEDQVRKEQERISKQVAERSVVGKPPKAAMGGKRKPSAANSSDASSGAPTGQEEASDEARAALRAKILGDLKERGRVKWRVLARMIMTSLKTAMSDDKIVISSTKKGTHFSFRLKSKDASGGALVVRLHRRRKDRTASVGEARGLVDELIELVFKILQQQ